MWWRAILAVAVLMLVTSGLLRWREERNYRPSLAAEAQQAQEITIGTLYAGGSPRGSPEAQTRAELNSYDVGQGKKLYSWFNCVGCHAMGGGDIGPPLMDDKWIYGAQPANIRASIVEGRPNGMPAFRGKIPEAQVWQLVAYIRSMSGQVPIYAAPGRSDDIRAVPSETLAPKAQPIQGGSPPSDAGK